MVGHLDAIVGGTSIASCQDALTPAISVFAETDIVVLHQIAYDLTQLPRHYVLMFAHVEYIHRVIQWIEVETRCLSQLSFRKEGALCSMQYQVVVYNFRLHVQFTQNRICEGIHGDFPICGLCDAVDG